MLIDWVTARVPLLDLDVDSLDLAMMIGDRIARYCPKTGDTRYETMAWDSIRSDSHQISVRVGSTDLWIQGSPARVCGDGCAVFGSGASARLDVAACVDAMRLFVQSQTGIKLPSDISAWKVSRVDVTGNLLLDSPTEVKDALKILRDCEGGRYRVSQQAGDTVYWSHKSKLRSGKAYAKGPHLTHLMKSRTYEGIEYTPEDINLASRLLRLELKLGREFWARHDWKSFTASDLATEWNDYFARMIGGCEMKTDADLKTRIMAVAPSEGRGKAAYGCWLLIQSEGWERAQESFGRSSWYNHLKVLRAAGLGDADLSAGQVVPLRRRVFEAQLCQSWTQLRAA